MDSSGGANHSLRDVIGTRGELIVELCLTDFEHSAEPLFRPTHLGEKWPAVDFYVELTNVAGKRPFFLAQVKATGDPKNPTKALRISSTKRDLARLLEIPAPTYVLGVHEPSRRVFIRSVHEGVAIKAMNSIPTANELTSSNLKVLHDEVMRFWKRGRHKPKNSVFL